MARTLTAKGHNRIQVAALARTSSILTPGAGAVKVGSASLPLASLGDSAPSDVFPL